MYLQIKYSSKKALQNISDELDLINSLTEYLSAQGYKYSLYISSRTFLISPVNEKEDQILFAGIKEIQNDFEDDYDILFYEIEKE